METKQAATAPGGYPEVANQIVSAVQNSVTIAGVPLDAFTGSTLHRVIRENGTAHRWPASWNRSTTWCVDAFVDDYLEALAPLIRGIPLTEQPIASGGLTGVFSLYTSEMLNCAQQNAIELVIERFNDEEIQDSRRMLTDSGD